MNRAERIQGFVVELWNWYARHKRTLPWRDLWDLSSDERAYRVLVSEIMLQQTQVSRCIGAFKRFLEAFPDVESLARASNRDVLMAWRGMGYNSRALRLRDAAKAITSRTSGFGPRTSDGLQTPENRLRRSTKSSVRSPSPFFPREINELLSIPGVGQYTAAAIRNFAFNLSTPCLDTNIRRVLHRTFVGPENADGSWKRDDGYLLKLAGETLDAALDPKKFSTFHFPLSTRGVTRDAANWHAALMDFGSLVQTKRNPKWEICPLTEKGIMVTTRRSFERRALSFEKYSRLTAQDSKLQEPGRMVGSRFIPNRIFRGKIVEALRDQPHGMTLRELGRNVCIDWNPKAHRRWMQELLRKLQSDRLVQTKGERYVLG